MHKHHRRDMGGVVVGVRAQLRRRVRLLREHGVDAAHPPHRLDGLAEEGAHDGEDVGVVGDAFHEERLGADAALAARAHLPAAVGEHPDLACVLVGPGVAWVFEPRFRIVAVQQIMRNVLPDVVRGLLERLRLVDQATLDQIAVLAEVGDLGGVQVCA